MAEALSSMGGKRLASARTAVDFAVPFHLRLRPPPMDGLMAFSKGPISFLLDQQ